jgi:hypothetical protein
MWGIKAACFDRWIKFYSLPLSTLIASHLSYCERPTAVVFFHMDLPSPEVSNHLKLSLFSYLSSPIKKRQCFKELPVWETIASNIREIQHHHIDTLTFSKTYTLVYNSMYCSLAPMVLSLAPMFYNGVTNLVIENLDRLAKEIIFPNLPSGLELDPMKRRSEDEKVLEAVYNAWSDHTDSVKKVSHIVKPLVCYSTSALPHTLNVYPT